MMIRCLMRNQVDLAQSFSKMSSIVPQLACHRLNLNPLDKSLKQKKRQCSVEKRRIMAKEVNRLIQVGFIRSNSYL